MLIIKCIQMFMTNDSFYEFPDRGLISKSSRSMIRFSYAVAHNYSNNFA